MPMSLICSVIMLWITEWFMDIPNEFNYLVDKKASAKNPHCRILNTTFHQEQCRACAAFAMSTHAAIHQCLYKNRDYIPSPYRLFDCTVGSCLQGASALDLFDNLQMVDVGDISASAQKFGLPCPTKSWWNLGSIFYPYGLWVIRGATVIKSQILLFGPLMGALDIDAHDQMEDGVFMNPSLAMSAKVNPSERHMVVLIGWGQYPRPHWIIINSWGNQWGENGRGKVTEDMLLFAIGLDDGLATEIFRICFLYEFDMILLMGLLGMYKIILCKYAMSIRTSENSSY